jgi:hypothetical protein
MAAAKMMLLQFGKPSSMFSPVRFKLCTYSSRGGLKWLSRCHYKTQRHTALRRAESPQWHARIASRRSIRRLFPMLRLTKNQCCRPFWLAAPAAPSVWLPALYHGKDGRCRKHDIDAWGESCLVWNECITLSTPAPEITIHLCVVVDDPDFNACVRV